MQRLTQREKEIIQYIAHGYSNEEIANRLYLSKETIKMHLKTIFKKLDVTNRVMLAVKAVTTGLTDINKNEHNTENNI